jgi:hypothetical protein
MTVSKEILNQYTNLQKECVEVREKINKLEKQIEKIEDEGAVIDKVRGGEGGLQSFRIEGFPYPEYSRKKTLLFARKAKLSEIELDLLEKVNMVEEYISSLSDSHIRRIISLRVVEGLSWNKIAIKMGGNNTEDSVRMSYNRFIENN